MQRLRRHHRADRLENEARPKSFSLGKWVYLFVLVGFALWLLYIFFGHLVFFRADGLVVKEQNRIAVPYAARVVELDAEIGDTVRKGERVARVHSLSLRETMAQLQTQLAENRRERSQLQARRAELDALMPIAERRAARMDEILNKNSQAYDQGLTTSTNRSNLIEDEFAAAQDLARFKAERREIERQIAFLDDQRQDLEAQHTLFAEAYDNGAVRAPVDGRVYDVAATQGGVVRAADPILTVVSGRPYILAYVNPGGLDEIRVGEAVNIEFGVRRVRGTLTQLLPLSKQVPAAFQRSFEPQQRSQLIRVDFADGAVPPPTFSKVRITAADMLPNWIQDWFRDAPAEPAAPDKGTPFPE